MHKGFYVQHNFESTHQLTQATPGPPRLVPMYNMSRAREITFDYGCSVFERLYELDGDTQNTSTSETSLPVSLSAGFQDHLVARTRHRRFGHDKGVVATARGPGSTSRVSRDTITERTWHSVLRRIRRSRSSRDVIYECSDNLVHEIQILMRARCSKHLQHTLIFCETRHPRIHILS